MVKHYMCIFQYELLAIAGLKQMEGNCLYGDFEVKGGFRGLRFLFCVDAFDALGLAVWIDGTRSARAKAACR